VWAGSLGTIPLIYGLARLLVGALAAPFNAVSKNPRPVALSTFPDMRSDLPKQAQIFFDPDWIDLEFTEAAEPGYCTMTLQAGPQVDWMKSLQFVVSDGENTGVDLAISTQGTRREQSLTIPWDALSNRYARVILGKAKLFGVLTQMYDLNFVPYIRGFDLTVKWMRD